MSKTALELLEEQQKKTEKFSAQWMVAEQLNESDEEELRASERLRADLVSELEAMKSRPKEVAVEKVVDQQAIDKAAADARKAASQGKRPPRSMKK